eukprot:2837234-Prymnesium_polylepis.1
MMPAPQRRARRTAPHVTMLVPETALPLSFRFQRVNCPCLVCPRWVTCVGSTGNPNSCQHTACQTLPRGLLRSTT